jgi:hypothetical protein
MDSLTTCWAQELTELLPILYIQQQKFVVESKSPEKHKKSMHSSTLEFSSTVKIAKKLEIQPSSQQLVEENKEGTKEKQVIDKSDKVKKGSPVPQQSSDTELTDKTSLSAEPKVRGH